MEGGKKKRAPPKPPNYQKWEMPERMTVRGVRDFFDYIIKDYDDAKMIYGDMETGEYYSKSTFRNIMYLRADKNKRDDVLKKYNDGPVYKMELFDKYLKDSLDAYYAGKTKIDVNGVDKSIPDFKNLYKITPNDNNRGYNYKTPSDIKGELEQMVISHISSDLRAIFDPNNEEDNPPVKKTRKPRVKKEADIIPVITSLISPIERKAIKAGQVKLIAETEKASATKIQQAIRNKKARDTVSKMKAEKKVISVPIPKTKKEKKVKPVYKMSYSQAVKIWNASRSGAMFCSPRKNTDEYKEVMALRM